MMALHPEYNKKINHAHLMAPAAFMKNSNVEDYYSDFKELCEDTGFHKITKNGLQLYDIAKRVCRSPNKKKKALCRLFKWLGEFQSVEPVSYAQKFEKNSSKIIFMVLIMTTFRYLYCLLQEMQSYIYKYVPAGVSLWQILHFAQLAASGKFQQFDYDDKKLNLKHYGQETPPEFDLKKVSADIYTYKSKDDFTTSMKNIKKLEKMLPNVKKARVVSDLSHTDFIYSEDAVVEVYAKLIADMLEADNKKG